MVPLSSLPPAVILAAGAGSRLAKTGSGPVKPLTPLLGQTLLERTLLSCRHAGVRDFFVVVGFQKAAVSGHAEALARRHDLSIRCIESPAWPLGNGASAAACAPHIRGPFFLMMCDHLFEPGILHDLLAAEDGAEVCRLAVDRRMEEIFDPEDATLVRLDGPAVTAIGKTIEAPHAADTGFFLCRPLVFEALAQAQNQGQGSLSDGIRRLAEKKKMRAVDVSGRFWHDVDTPEALAEGVARLAGNDRGESIIMP